MPRSLRIALCLTRLGVIVLSLACCALADVFSWEADTFPEEGGWDIVQIVCDPDLWIDDGWFFVHVELCKGYPPPGGQEATYRRSLEEFIDEDMFFIEWRMESDGDRSELPWGGPAGFSAWSNGGVNYLFSIASDQMDLNRDNTLPIVVVDFEAGVPHTHRLELYGDELYVWFLDGEIVDWGVPEGAFPSFNPNMNLRTKAAFLPNTTKWDYVRYGTIPTDGSGDFDSDSDLDLRDYRYFAECGENSGAGVDAGPGCVWADMDGDSDVDLRDFGLFQVAFTGAE